MFFWNALFSATFLSMFILFLFKKEIGVINDFISRIFQKRIHPLSEFWPQLEQKSLWPKGDNKRGGFGDRPRVWP